MVKRQILQAWVLLVFGWNTCTDNTTRPLTLTEAPLRVALVSTQRTAGIHTRIKQIELMTFMC